MLRERGSGGERLEPPLSARRFRERVSVVSGLRIGELATRAGVNRETIR